MEWQPQMDVPSSSQAQAQPMCSCSRPTPLLVTRPGSRCYQSPRHPRPDPTGVSRQDMLHDYNMPFQLGRVEDDDFEDEVDSPDNAELYDIEVKSVS